MGELMKNAGAPAKPELIARFCRRLAAAGSIGRALTAAWIASVDPVLSVMERCAGLLRWRRRQEMMADWRRCWRQDFEDGVCDEANKLIAVVAGTLIDTYAAGGYELPEGVRERMCQRLVESLLEDQSFLQQIAIGDLPVGVAAFRRVMNAVDRTLPLHFPIVAAEIFGHAPVGTGGYAEVEA